MARIDKKSSGTHIKLKKNDSAIVFENGQIHFLCSDKVAKLMNENEDGTQDGFDYFVATSALQIIDFFNTNFGGE
jgi:hypothetical protein